MPAQPRRCAARARARRPSRERGRTASRTRVAGRRSLLEQCPCVARLEEAHALAVLVTSKHGSAQPQREQEQAAHALRFTRAAMLVEPPQVTTQVLDVQRAAV